MSNIVEAVFKGGENGAVYTRTASQWDRGVKLKITGLELPTIYHVQFSNGADGGVSIGRKVYGYLIDIPDTFLQSGEYVHVWIGLSAQEETVAAAYEIIIPVKKRPPIYYDRDGFDDIDASIDERTETLILHGKNAGPGSSGNNQNTLMQGGFIP